MGMRIRTGTALLVVLAATAGCGVSSDAHMGTSAPYTYTWAPLPAAMTATTACPQADWRCLKPAAERLGRAVVGPSRASRARVLGLTYYRPQASSAVESVSFRMSRPGGGESASVGQNTDQWQDLSADLVRNGGLPVTIAGSVGAFYDHDHFQNLAWNEGGLGLQLSIRKSPGSPAPTEAELVALATSLVVYQP